VLLNPTFTASQGTCNGTPLCALGSLNAGASATVYVRGTVPPLTRGSTFNGTFTAASSNPDPNNNNNSVTATTTVR
jgi:hypothetical protein